MLVNMNPEPEDSEQEEDTFRGRLRMLALRVGSVTALAKAAGIPQSTIRRYFDKSDPPLPALPKLARAGNVSLAWFITGEGPMQIEEENAYIRIRQLSLEGRSDNPSEIDEKGPNQNILFRTEWLRLKFSAQSPEEQFSVLLVQEHGMEPTLNVGDVILIDHALRDPFEGFIYLFQYKNGMSQLKRLKTVDPNTLSALSDNPGYAAITFPRTELGQSVEIVGRVVWVGHALSPLA
jgi:phage repressor protein C with HTH and peptisase S24 domain